MYSGLFLESVISNNCFPRIFLHSRQSLIIKGDLTKLNSVFTIFPLQNNLHLFIFCYVNDNLRNNKIIYIK